MTPTRLKFELIDQQSFDRVSNPLSQLSSRMRKEEARPEELRHADLRHADFRYAEQPRSIERPRLLSDLADGLDFLISQLTRAEEERDHARIETERWKAESSKTRVEFGELQLEFKSTSEGTAELRETRKTLENVITEQQKALLLSMELMKRFENEVSSLRNRMDAMEAAPPFTAPAAATETVVPDTSATERDELLIELKSEQERRVSAELENRELRAQVEAALEALQKLRDDPSGQVDQSAAIRSLEEQFEISRVAAASARADLSIQAAELETKDALISALERALEQQRGSLQNLESRFGAYAGRLQEMRIARVRNPDSGFETPSIAGRLLQGFKSRFSPSAKGAEEPEE